MGYVPPGEIGGGVPSFAGDVDETMDARTNEFAAVVAFSLSDSSLEGHAD